ncbi:hypothetical protein Tco_1541876 [Tanacetum coccineum]
MVSFYSSDIVSCAMVSLISQASSCMGGTCNMRIDMIIGRCSLVVLLPVSEDEFETLVPYSLEHMHRHVIHHLEGYTEYHNPPSIALALSRAPPVVEFYSGDIVSRRVLTLCIPSPLLGLLLLWLLLLGPRAVPACTTLSNSHKIRNDILESQKCSSYHASLSTLESHIASLEAEKARLEAVEVSLRKEVNDVKRDRIEVVSKVVPYAAMELIYSDDMGSLVGRLISSAIFYGRCKAFEQVAEMKEPFDLSKVKG